jgi:hypothetical protein
MTDRTDIESYLMSDGSYRLLRAVVIAALFCGLFLGVSAAEPEFRLSQKKIREEVRTVVETQLAALRTGNFPAAYEMASEGIKTQFDLALFSVLMRRGYPTLLQAKTAELGVVRDKGGKLALISVSMLDRQNRAVVYDFWLVEEAKGWRVNGVVLEQSSSRAEF